MRPGQAATHPGALRVLARPTTHSHQLTAAPGREGLTYKSYSRRRHLASVAAAARATSPSSLRSLARSGHRTRNSRDRPFPSYVDGDRNAFPGRSRQLTHRTKTERSGAGPGRGLGGAWAGGSVGVAARRGLRSSACSVLESVPSACFTSTVILVKSPRRKQRKSAADPFSPPSVDI